MDDKETQLEKDTDNSMKSNKMVDGVIWKQLLFFSIPLLIGNLFQQLYNTVDSVIVGNYVGNSALAAVGSSNSLINMLIGFFMGMSTGAGVIISQFYGAKQREKVHDAVHTAIALALCSSFCLMIIGIVFTPSILKLMGTPADVLPDSTIYLRVYFAGIIGVMLYNVGTGILNAVGDSKTPIYYLVTASLTNVCLDLLFVIVFHMGVLGVALATTISQFVAAVLIMRKLIRTEDIYKIVLKEIKVKKYFFTKIIKVGLPAGMQQSVISFSNVIVQTKINSFGAAAMAGCGAYTKIDGFVLLPVMSFALAITTFVGQNIGAGKLDRVKKGAKVCLLMVAGVIAVISILLYFFGENILGIFSKDPEVVYYATYMLKTLTPCYILVSLAHAMAGIIRGAGQAFVPMFILVMNMCVVRIIWLTIMMPIWKNIAVVFFGYNITWVTSLLFMFLYYKKGKWLKKV